MLVVRLLLVLLFLMAGVSIGLYLLTGKRHFLDYFRLVLKALVVFLMLVGALFLIERIILI